MALSPGPKIPVRFAFPDRDWITINHQIRGRGVDDNNVTWLLSTAKLGVLRVVSDFCYVTQLMLGVVTLSLVIDFRRPYGIGVLCAFPKPGFRTTFLNRKVIGSIATLILL